jgi:two-component sensor histidine kinase
MTRVNPHYLENRLQKHNTPRSGANPTSTRQRKMNIGPTTRISPETQTILMQIIQEIVSNSEFRLLVWLAGMEGS